MSVTNKLAPDVIADLNELHRKGTLGFNIRNIYLVTDGQDPGLDEEIKSRFPEKAGCLKIVDHKEIFRDYERYLPTFNSSSIHSMIWRIKDLSERFVYLNDDQILIREHREEDWFTGNRPVLMGRWLLPPGRPL